jgi:hypothetical protein
MTTYALTTEDRLRAQSDTARAKRAATREAKQRLIDEDIILLARRGLDPAPIALRVQVPINRVVSMMEEAGLRVNPYAERWGPTPEGDTCPHCGKNR